MWKKLKFFCGIEGIVNRKHFQYPPPPLTFNFSVCRHFVALAKLSNNVVAALCTTFSADENINVK